jgi:hypothetical protein
MQDPGGGERDEEKETRVERQRKRILGKTRRNGNVLKKPTRRVQEEGSFVPVRAGFESSWVESMGAFSIRVRNKADLESTSQAGLVRRWLGVNGARDPQMAGGGARMGSMGRLDGIGSHGNWQEEETRCDEEKRRKKGSFNECQEKGGQMQSR